RWLLSAKDPENSDPVALADKIDVAMFVEPFFQRVPLRNSWPFALRSVELKASRTCLRTHPNPSASEPCLWVGSRWSLSWLRSDLPCPCPLAAWPLCQSMVHRS